MAIVALIALAGAVVSGFLGFVVYPARTRKTRKRRPPPAQGMARAMFVIFAAGAFVAFFFGVLAP